MEDNIWNRLDEEYLKEQLLNEMARIGSMGDLLIYIRTNDPGNYPHFHIIDENTLGRKFHCCVRIDCAKYFIHTGKEDTLNSGRRKELIKFLTSPSEDEPQKTNWQVVLIEWNRNNSKRKIPMDLQIPNYKELN